MTILLISLFVYFLLCVAATIAMEITPKRFFAEFSTIVGNDYNRRIGRVLAMIFVAIALTIFYVLAFVAMPVLFLIFYNKRDSQIETNAEAETKRKSEELALAEEKKRMEKVMAKNSQIKKIRDNEYLPLKTQIIYVESEYDEKLNDFFRRNNKDVRRIFWEEYNRKYKFIDWYDYLSISAQDFGYDFVYLPEYYSSDIVDETICYAAPSLDASHRKGIDVKELATRFYSWFMSNCSITSQNESETAEIKHGLVRLIRTVDDEYRGVVEDTYSYYPLEYTNDEDVFLQIREYLEFVGNGHPAMYNIHTEKGKDFADSEFPIEAQKLADEITERVIKLRNMGVNSFLIKQLFIEPPKPSHLLITEDFRIVLPDYNDKEIKMAFLPKVVFFFFLRHPEGVRFKQLRDYKKELFAIYRRVSNRENEDKMTESINDIIDSTKNSINEKCSRIREAFLREFDNEIACNYFVTYIDKSNHTKAIILDRSLVVDESGIMEM